MSGHAEIRYGLVDEQEHFSCLAATPAQARQNIRDNYRAWKARRPKGDVVTFADYMAGRQYVKLTIANWEPEES